MATLKELLIAQQRAYFTDRDEVMGIFRELTQAPIRNRLYRFMVIYGPGGIGKTMVTRKFRDICNDIGIPSSIANMDSINSPLDILTSFRENWELKHHTRAFGDFDELLVKFKDIQGKLQSKESMDNKVSDVVAKVAGTISSAAVGGAITGLALGPIGALVGAAGGALTNSVMETSIAALLKKGLISHKDANFLSNLLPNLISAFVHGMEKLADEKRGFVLVFDGFDYAEKSRHLNEWITESLFPSLGDCTFTVISGRNKPRGKFWQTYSSFVYQCRLKPFNISDMTKYLNARGVSMDQSASLLNLTGGLPLGAALWTDVEIQKQAGLLDVISEQRSAEVLNTVVDRLLENLDDRSKRAMRFCAIPRWFNESTLDPLLPDQEASEAFENLCKYSSLFRLETNGLSMHDEVRRYLLDDFKSRNLHDYRELNQKMAKFYESKAQSEYTYSLLWFKYRIEHVYHLIAADSQEGFNLLSGIVDDAHSMGDSSILDALLKVVTGLPDEQASYWTTYFEGEIYFLSQDYVQAKISLMKAAELDLPPVILSRILISLVNTLWNIDDHYTALHYGRKALEVCESIKDLRGTAFLYILLGWIHHHLGNITEALRLEERGFSLTSQLPNKPDLGWALNSLGTINLDLGHIRYAEELFRQAVSLWIELGRPTGKFFPLYHIGEICAETGRYKEAIEYYNAALESWPGSDDEIQVLIRLGEAIALQGDAEQSLSLLAKYRQDAHEKGKPIYEARASLFMGNTYLQQLKADEAYTCFTQATEITKKIGAKSLGAKALNGIVRLHYVRESPLPVILNAIEDLESSSHENGYHRQLGDANLYRGLAELREAVHSKGNEPVSDIELDTSASTFYKALMEALQFNSYTLDKTVSELCQELRALSFDIATRTLERVIKLWLSGNFDGQQVTEFERSRRERDNLDDHQMPIIERIKNELLNVGGHQR